MDDFIRLARKVLWIWAGIMALVILRVCTGGCTETPPSRTAARNVAAAPVQPAAPKPDPEPDWAALRAEQIERVYTGLLGKGGLSANVVSQSLQRLVRSGMEGKQLDGAVLSGIDLALSKGPPPTDPRERAALELYRIKVMIDRTGLPYDDVRRAHFLLMASGLRDDLLAAAWMAAVDIRALRCNVSEMDRFVMQMIKADAMKRHRMELDVLRQAKAKKLGEYATTHRCPS